MTSTSITFGEQEADIDGARPATLLVHHQRIDLDVRHVGTALQDRPDPQNRLDHDPRVLAPLAPHPEQQRVGLDLLDHRPRLAPVQRQRPEHHVLHHLDVDPPQAEHHHRPETRVPPRPDDRLDPLGHHLAHLDTVDPRPRNPRPAVVQDRLVGVEHLLAVVQVERDAAGVALVQDVARDDLQHHRIADRLGRPHRLVHAPADPHLRPRNPCRHPHRPETYKHRNEAPGSSM
jgi:hypothetical protein